MWKKRKDSRIWLLYFTLMLLMIFNAKLVADGAREGISLCLNSVLPTLFPFCILSMMIRTAIGTDDLLFLRPIERICRIPHGSGSILLLGALGGYPIGAVCIEQSIQTGQLEISDGKRMISFCNNAGPAFIFGILSSVFMSKRILFSIWLVQLISAILTGCLLPGKPGKRIIITRKNVSFKQVLYESVQAMINICCLVILYRIIIVFLKRWILCYLPLTVSILLSGIIELTIGICSINEIPSYSVRFVVSCVMLVFGGICVLLQVKRVCPSIMVKDYLKGKLLQTTIATILASIISLFL